MSPENNLSSLLQGWQTGPEPAPWFNRNVWLRIETTESRRQNGLLSMFSWVGLLARPRIASFCRGGRPSEAFCSADFRPAAPKRSAISSR